HRGPALRRADAGPAVAAGAARRGGAAGRRPRTGQPGAVLGRHPRLPGGAPAPRLRRGEPRLAGDRRPLPLPAAPLLHLLPDLLGRLDYRRLVALGATAAAGHRRRLRGRRQGRGAEVPAHRPGRRLPRLQAAHRLPLAALPLLTAGAAAKKKAGLAPASCTRCCDSAQFRRSPTSLIACSTRASPFVGICWISSRRAASTATSADRARTSATACASAWPIFSATARSRRAISVSSDSLASAVSRNASSRAAATMPSASLSASSRLRPYSSSSALASARSRSASLSSFSIRRIRSSSTFPIIFGTPK